MGPSQDQKAAFKLAQLYKFSDCAYSFDDKVLTKIIANLLEKEGDVNYEIPIDGPARLTRSYTIGYTPLYYVYNLHQIELFTNLLNNGTADYTSKNSKGQTILHKMIRKPKHIDGPLDSPFVNAVLSAHVNLNNSSNPCDKNGFTHFHIACMSRNTTAVKFFLDNGVSVDEPVSMDSKITPGYTPLHFAAMRANTEVVEILFEYGANMHLANARGITPLHLLIKLRLKMIDSMRNATSEKGESCEKLQEQIMENEKIINMFMENLSTDNDSLDRIGLSTFHVACMLQDLSVAQELADRVTDLDHRVNEDSSLWPGYTALHFAAYFSIDTVEMLIKKGADLASKDARGLTPIDLCIERYEIEDIYQLLSLDLRYKNLLFSDGHTQLLTFIDTLESRPYCTKLMNILMKNINTSIPMELALWPGYTPLHLAVLFAKKSKPNSNEDKEPKNAVDLQIIRLCLSKGADLSIQDSRGRTALHLAYRLNKMTVVDALLRHTKKIPNVLDEDSLSHLHIVIAVNKKKHMLKKCVLNSTVVNVAYKGNSPINDVRPGATPLHVCVVDPHPDEDDVQNVIKILLKNGADVRLKDTYGLTPAHWLLSHGRSLMPNVILKQESIDCVAEEYGLSHLHVACYMNDHAAAKRLLQNGADVNLAIKYTSKDEDDPLSFLSQYNNYTPLNLCIFVAKEMQELLLEYGADVVSNEKGRVPLRSTVYHNFISKVLNDAKLQKQMERKCGWRKVHLAAFLHQLDGSKVTKRNVNARVFSNSPIWKGYTPLHVLVHHTNGDDQLRILLENGADVTAINDEEQNSPVGMMFNREYSVDDRVRKTATLLMKYHKDFNVNPVNSHGISHFHVACYLNDVEAVRGFISHGVDVNHPVDYFADWCPGYTPLHLASKLEVVELLIDHGADIHTEDIRGCNVLSEALRRDVFDESVVKKIIESGAEINRPNFRGETPLELALIHNKMTIEKLRFCISQGFIVNSCNPITGIGYASIVLGSYSHEKQTQQLIAKTIMNEKLKSTISGRNALHHLVTKSHEIHPDDYAFIIEKLIESGCGIDEQDNEGKTALHVSVDFKSVDGVRDLLDSGADINVVDNNGKSAFYYAFARATTAKEYESESESIYEKLIVHACRLALLNLELSEHNINVVSQAPKSIQDSAAKSRFYYLINLSKERELNVGSMCLHDFLSETGAVATYPLLKLEDRKKIDQYFLSIISDRYLREIKSIFKLQYRKAVRRLELLPSATNSFRLLLGFHFPDLCTEDVFKYLSNSDLKNIVSAEIGNGDMRMDVD